MGVFSTWQPVYAEHNVAAFPVTAEKRPAVRGFLKVGLPGSRALAAKFGESDALGFSVGRSGLTVLDVDAADENLLADAMSERGPSPLIIRTGGGFQAYYAHNGEKRQIRPDPAVPIDILAGESFVVGAPSRVSKGTYSLIQGSLADLPNLPVMRALKGAGIPAPTNLTPPPPPLPAPAPALPAVGAGYRNGVLWNHCMHEAVHCDDVDALIDVARTANSEFASPLPDDEVVGRAISAWGYESRGENWIGRGRRRPAPTDPDGLIWESPDGFVLWKVLRYYNGGRPKFYVTNEMRKLMPPTAWDRERFAAARRALLEHKHIRLLQAARTGAAAIYAWGDHQ